MFIVNLFINIIYFTNVVLKPKLHFRPRVHAKLTCMHVNYKLRKKKLDSRRVRQLTDIRLKVTIQDVCE
jgi:hypothetical protein